MTGRAVLVGLDLGGTGSRAVRVSVGPDASVGPRTECAGPGVCVTATGSDAARVVAELIDRALPTGESGALTVKAVGIGASGVSSLIADPEQVLVDVQRRVSCPVALAADAVTAHLGALGGAGGVVVALGTGAIAVAHPGPDELPRAPWRRADGWGHLLGDRGGGAWLGRRGLELALVTHDGLDRRGAVLLDAAQHRFGAPSGWPRLFYTRADRAGLLASFARDVIALANAGDPTARALVTNAGAHAARTAAALLDEHLPPRVSVTGGLAAASEALVAAFSVELHRCAPRARVVTPAGSPLDGAVHLAQLAAAGRTAAHPGLVWVTPDTTGGQPHSATGAV